MLNNNIKLNENEVVKYDVDHYMDKQLSMFQEIVKGIEEDKIKQFRNWVKLFKTLNYDIIEGLEVRNIYRFNKSSAVVELEFNKKTEYDFIAFNEKEMSVTVITVKGGQVDKHVVKRLLIPTTVEEALMYVESEVDNVIIDSLAITYKELMNDKNKFKISDGLNRYILPKVDFKIDYKKEEKKVEVKQETKKEEKKVEVKQETKKEEKKVEVKQETKKEEKKVETKKVEEKKVVAKQETKKVEKKTQEKFNNGVKENQYYLDFARKLAGQQNQIKHTSTKVSSEGRPWVKKYSFNDHKYVNKID
jgi:hypothetical protein